MVCIFKDILRQKPKITPNIDSDNTKFAKVVISNESERNLMRFQTQSCHRFNFDKSTCFQGNIAGVIDDSKSWSNMRKIIRYLWFMNSQISHGEYTLFSANIFVKLRA